MQFAHSLHIILEIEKYKEIVQGERVFPEYMENSQILNLKNSFSTEKLRRSIKTYK